MTSPSVVSIAGVLGGKTVTAIAAGFLHSCAIADARAYCWGQGGRLGIASGAQSNVPVAVSTAGVLSGRNVTDLAVGLEHSCVIADGLVFCWGNGAQGRLGQGVAASSQVPVAVSTGGVLAGKTVTSVSAGDTHTCVIADGAPYCWGTNAQGELGNGANAQSNVPVAVLTTGALAGKTVTAISAGSNVTCVVADGQVFCWGSGANGQRGDGTSLDVNVPMAVDNSGALAGLTVTDVDARNYSTCVIASGRAFCWGANSWGSLGIGSVTGSMVPAEVIDTTMSSVPIQEIEAGSTACARNADGVYCWGRNLQGQIGRPHPAGSAVPVAVASTGPLAGKTIDKVVVGNAATCALAEGKAYCWGYNPMGMLGDGTTNPTSIPVKVVDTGVLAGKVVTDIAVGIGSACAIADGQPYCWGGPGVLGNGLVNRTVPSYVPVAVSTAGFLAGKTSTKVTVGATTACVIADGRPYCWGQPFNGSLGNGNAVNSANTPDAVDVSGVLAGRTVTDISVAGRYGCVVADGLPFCWGQNDDGQVGNGSTTDALVPVAVDLSGVLAGKTVTKISTASSGSGNNHTCAIADGQAYCWGDNSFGQLGNGTTVNSTVPVAVDVSGALSGKVVTDIEASDDGRTCAIADGRAYCWGGSLNGQLGNGDTSSSTIFPSPVAVDTSGVLGGKTVVDLDAGSSTAHTCALADGQIYCWGQDNWGALGSGAYAYVVEPVGVGAFPPPPDVVAPSITITSPVGGSVPWNSSLTAGYSCVDNVGGSGIATCTGSVADGASINTTTPGNYTFTVVATDIAGNSVTATRSYAVLPETVAPSVAIVTPIQGATYFTGTSVLADYSCTDDVGGSGIDTCVGPVTNGSPINTAVPGAYSFTVTATDRHGNSASATYTYSVVGDIVAPTVTITTPAAGASYLVGTPVVANYTCADSGSGLASCVGPVANGAAISTSTPGTYTFSVTATDNAGNTHTESHTYTVYADTTAPTVTLTTPGAGQVVQIGDVLVADFSCADAGGSGLVSCIGTEPNGTTLDTSTPGTYTFTVIATDGAGNTTPVTHTWTVDLEHVDPTVSITTPAAGASYLVGTPVVADYSCADTGGSGLASCVGPVANGATVSTATPGTYTFSVTATDGAGNTHTEAHTYTVYADTTAPTVTLATPGAGQLVQIGDPLVANFSCADAGGSGLVSCIGTQANGSTLDTSTPGTYTFTVIATDGAGNTASVTHTWTVDVEHVAPTVSIATPANGASYLVGTPVTASYSCADAGGSGLASCVGPVANGAAISTTTPGSYTFTVTATDGAGNTASATHAYTVYADTTPPTVNIVTPAAGATYAIGQAVTASYSCADTGGSGLVSCVGPVADGAAINTSTPGTYTFTVTATDGAGNTATGTRTYTVAGADTTAPTISITSPLNGDVIPRNQVVAAAFTCSDEVGGSGLASCVGTIPNGAPLPTSTIGFYSLTVTARDVAGNETVLTHTYVVVPPALTLYPQCEPLQEMARWDFDDAALPWKDSSPAARNLAPNGTPLRVPVGGGDPTNHAARLDRGDYLRYQPAASDALLAKCFTMDLWVRERGPMVATNARDGWTSNATAAYDTVFGAWGPRNEVAGGPASTATNKSLLRIQPEPRANLANATQQQYGHSFGSHGAVPGWDGATFTSQGRTSYRPKAAATTWTHLTFVFGRVSAVTGAYDGWILYVNGQPDRGASTGRENNPPMMWSRYSPFNLGWSGDARATNPATYPSDFCNCDIDGVRILRGAMTPAMVAADHAAEAGRY